MNNTQDLSKLGYREIGQLAELLTAYADQSWASQDDQLGNGVKWEYNPNSDNLFLVDEDYNVAMLNDDGKLENFLTCSNCGEEAMRSETQTLGKVWQDENTCYKTECQENS